MRLADLPDRYQGKFSVQFTHPLLVRCAIDYSPIKGAGPTFRHEFVLTPDGVLATLHATGVEEFGVTWPLLADDGAPLHTKVGGHFAVTAYQEDGDEESFLSPGAGAVTADDAERVQSTYGWLLPVRALAADGVQQSFVYPRSPNDPPAAKVQASFHATGDGFDSSIGSVHGSLYVGRTSAGGEGSTRSIAMETESPTATFDPLSCPVYCCNCVMARSIAVEADAGRAPRRTSVDGRFCSISVCAHGDAHATARCPALKLNAHDDDGVTPTASANQPRVAELSVGLPW